jgi:hypothetical protein
MDPKMRFENTYITLQNVLMVCVPIADEEGENHHGEDGEDEDDVEGAAELVKDQVDLRIDHITLDDQADREVHKSSRHRGEILRYQGEISQDNSTIIRVNVKAVPKYLLLLLLLLMSEIPDYEALLSEIVLDV